MASAYTPEILADVRVPSDPRMSPDGRWVAATVAPVGKRDAHRASAIWLASTAGDIDARQLTSGLAEDSHPRWAPDSQRLVFVSDRAKRGVNQLYLLNLAGGEATALTDEAGGVADAAWLASGDRLVYLALDAEDAADIERREKQRDDARVYGAFWARAKPVFLDVATQSVRRYDIGERHVAAFSASPDGSKLALALWPTTELDWFIRGGAIGVLDCASGELEIVTEPGFFSEDLVWSPDGTTLFLAGSAGPTAVSSSQLWSVDACSGARPQPLAHDSPFCVDAIARGSNAEDVVAVLATGTASSVARWHNSAWEQLAHFNGALQALSVSDDGSVIGLLGSTAESALDIYAGPPSGPLKRISALNPQLGDIELGAQEVVTWERAGFTLDGILIFPPGKSRADGPLPTIASIHGGPYGRWTNGYHGHRFGRWLAQFGYLVLLPNPRGGAGHGKAFASAVLHSVGNDDYLDIMAGVDFLVAQGLADERRLGVGGWSQGGFMTAWIVGHTDRFRAGVMGAGVSDWGMMVATSDIPAYETLMGGGDPYSSAGPHSFDAQSPISYVANASTPTLIVHGELDERVPVSQGIFMHRGLRQHGVPTELVTYPREPHGIQERQHQLDLTRRIGEWYKRWIPLD